MASQVASGFVVVLSLLSLCNAQIAQGGGAAIATTVIAVQYPTVVVGPSLFVNAAGLTSAVQLPFTQTFKSPLGTWAYPTAVAGSIGLGNIQGTVGAVRVKGS